ncbi:MAG: hypothetical protein WKF84_28735 [Pyrinomonadaceae bacterium]
MSTCLRERRSIHKRFRPLSFRRTEAAAGKHLTGRPVLTDCHKEHEMTSTKLVTEFAALEKRRAEVAADTEAARAAYTTAQDGLLKGTTHASDITSTHSAAMALQSALSSLDGKIAEARAEISATKADEEREALKARVDALTAEALAARERHFDVLREAAHALSQAVTKMLDLRARYNDLSRQVRALDGEGLGYPEWQKTETAIAPFVLQAALAVARGRERKG